MPSPLRTAQQESRCTGKRKRHTAEKYAGNHDRTRCLRIAVPLKEEVPDSGAKERRGAGKVKLIAAEQRIVNLPGKGNRLSGRQFREDIAGEHDPVQHSGTERTGEIVRRMQQRGRGGIELGSSIRGLPSAVMVQKRMQHAAEREQHRAEQQKQSSFVLPFILHRHPIRKPAIYAAANSTRRI